MSRQKVFQKITVLHLIGGGVLLLVLAIGSVFLFAPQTFAAWGSGGSGGGGGGSYSTSNGFGWKKFSKTGSGPNGGFRDGTSWNHVKTACAPYSGTSVWVHVVRGSGGQERGYNYWGSASNRDRPAAGGDPWMYNAAGVYSPQGAAGQTKVINIVRQVHAAFRVEHSAYDSHWGDDVAWFCDGPLKTNDWTIRAESYIEKGTAPDRSADVQGTITATPGEQLNWYHDMRNQGPDDMDKNVSYRIEKTGFSNGWNAITAPTGSTRGVYNALFVRVYATLNSPYTKYTVTQNDVGNTLCQRILWVPGSSANPSTFASVPTACATIPYDYALLPAITNITDDTPIETSTGTFPVEGNVTNNSGTTKSHPNIQWRITQVRFANAGAVTNKSGGISANDPCAFFTGNQSCSTIGSGTQAAGYMPNTPVTHSGTGSVENYDAGTYLCFALSVKRNSSTSTDWRHSMLRCHVVSKKPKVQVLGGDLFVGRGSANNPARIATVQTAITQDGTNNRTYGSWAEYAIVPSGVIFGMASGSGYAGGTSTGSVNLLSFTNSNTTGTPDCSVGSIGCYNHTSTAPNVPARFPTTGTAVNTLPGTNVNIANDTPSGVYVTTAGNVSVHSTNDIPAGRSVILNLPDTNVTITGNIRYTSGALNSVEDIPQVVIIARNILIAESVTRVDAWLITTGAGSDGRLNTCVIGGNEATLPTSETCNNQLIVNGPISANHLIMRRTYGADASNGMGTPAEVFNLRADAYIWATSYAPGTGRLPTATVNELPPRF